MPISDELIDQLLEGCSSPEEILGESGLLKQLTKKVAERALEAEMESHLGYSKHESAGKNTGNSRNGKQTQCTGLGSRSGPDSPGRKHVGARQHHF